VKKYLVDKFVDEKGVPWLEITKNCQVHEDDIYSDDVEIGESVCVGYISLRMCEVPELMAELYDAIENRQFDLLTVDGVH